MDASGVLEHETRQLLFSYHFPHFLPCSIVDWERVVDMQSKGKPLYIYVVCNYLVTALTACDIYMSLSGHGHALYLAAIQRVPSL